MDKSGVSGDLSKFEKSITAKVESIPVSSNDINEVIELSEEDKDFVEIDLAQHIKTLLNDAHNKLHLGYMEMGKLQAQFHAESIDLNERYKQQFTMLAKKQNRDFKEILDKFEYGTEVAEKYIENMKMRYNLRKQLEDDLQQKDEDRKTLFSKLKSLKIS